MTSLRFGMMACCILGLCRCCLAFLETVASERAGWCLVLSVVSCQASEPASSRIGGLFYFLWGGCRKALGPPSVWLGLFLLAPSCWMTWG